MVKDSKVPISMLKLHPRPACMAMYKGRTQEYKDQCNVQIYKRGEKYHVQTKAVRRHEGYR